MLIRDLLDKTIKVPENLFSDLCATYSLIWKETHPQAIVSTETTIDGTIKLAEQLSEHVDSMQAFVTGSLHLVGGTLDLLRPQSYYSIFVQVGTTEASY